MLTSLEWVSAVKSVHCIQSDYGVAKLLNISKTNIGSIRKRRSHLGIDMALSVAEQLKIDPSVVYLSAQMERAKTPEEYEMWLRIYERMNGPQVEENIRKLLKDKYMTQAYRFVRVAA